MNDTCRIPERPPSRAQLLTREKGTIHDWLTAIISIETRFPQAGGEVGGRDGAPGYAGVSYARSWSRRQSVRGRASRHRARRPDGGFLQSAEGEFPKAAIITEPAGPSSFVKKHIGPPKYEDNSLQCGPVMSKPLFDWIATTLAGNLVQKNGFIVNTSYDLKEQSRLQFNKALITEIAFPACDAALLREPAYLAVRLAPEFTRPTAGSGAV